MWNDPQVIAQTMVDDLAKQETPGGCDVMAAKFAALSAALSAALASGEYREPEEPRYPIIIAADSPVSSPEKLRALVDLSELPKTMTTVKRVDSRGVTYTEPADGGQEFQVCDVDLMSGKGSRKPPSTALSVSFSRG